jgi:hypothetical protein
VAQGVGPEFKSQYWKKKERNKQNPSMDDSLLGSQIIMNEIYDLCWEGDSDITTENG